MNEQATPSDAPANAAPDRMPRRRFLRVGCITAAAAGATVCGGAGLVSALRPTLPPPEFPTQAYGDLGGKRVLLAYASATGTTAEIATTLGGLLGERGFTVDVAPVKEAPAPVSYDAVIVGSAIQGGKVLPEALAYVTAHQASLSAVPTALFAVYFFNRGNDSQDQTRRQAYLNELRPLLPGVAEAYFAGRFDQRTLAVALPGWIARIMPTLDYRDWDAIRGWGRQVFALDMA